VERKFEAETRIQPEVEANDNNSDRHVCKTKAFIQLGKVFFLLDLKSPAHPSIV
jgi:hypothetical protein